MVNAKLPASGLGVWSRGGDIRERLKGGVRGDWTYEKGKGWGHWGWKGGGVKGGVEREGRYHDGVVG